MIIQSGRSELLVDEAPRIAEKAKALGVHAAVDLYDERMHFFSLFLFLPSTKKALQRIAGFANSLQSPLTRPVALTAT